MHGTSACVCSKMRGNRIISKSGAAEALLLLLISVADERGHWYLQTLNGGLFLSLISFPFHLSLSVSLLATFFDCACVFTYVLHIEDQYPHSTSEMMTFVRSEGIFTGPHHFKGLFQGEHLVNGPG